MDTPESSAPHAHPSTEEQDHPHACLNGYIYLSYTALREKGLTVTDLRNVLQGRGPTHPSAKKRTEKGQSLKWRENQRLVH